MKQFNLDPMEYRVLRGKRREPFFGPGWPLLVVYFVLWAVMTAAALVPEGSWLSPIARVISPL